MCPVWRLGGEDWVDFEPDNLRACHVSLAFWYLFLGFGLACVVCLRAGCIVVSFLDYQTNPDIVGTR